MIGGWFDQHSWMTFNAPIRALTSEKCSSYGVFGLENAIRCSPEILALGLCATCYTLKRQDAEYFGGLREQVLERDGYAMLINAQERERSRLASEIHDDFSHRLALMALELENAQENDKHVAEQGCPASPQCPEFCQRNRC
jgi:signal transduction histidine kinase